MGGDAGTGHDLGRVACEDGGVVAGVITHDDGRACPGSLVGAGEEVGGEAGGSLRHDHAVHSVGPCAERAAQTGRPELQPPGEPVADLVEIIGVHQFLELGTGDWIGILVDPFLGPLKKFSLHERHVKSSGGCRRGVRPSGWQRVFRPPGPPRG